MLSILPSAGFFLQCLQKYWVFFCNLLRDKNFSLHSSKAWCFPFFLFQNTWYFLYVLSTMGHRIQPMKNWWSLPLLFRGLKFYDSSLLRAWLSHSWFFEAWGAYSFLWELSLPVHLFKVEAHLNFVQFWGTIFCFSLGCRLSNFPMIR